MNSENDIQRLKQIRKEIFIAGYKGGMAHLASCFSCIEMIYAMYFKSILKYNIDDPKWDNRDRFILSKGHAGLALYAVLMKAGLISKDLYGSYLTEHSEIGGEPCRRDCEWIEASTGSLGHGLSFGLGMALALKTDGNPAGVYVMIGDGELEEGTVWEAIITAPHFELSNLTVILDCNRIQKMDFVENIIGQTNWREKIESFGWLVDEVDGHSVESFSSCLKKKNESFKPRFVIANTIKGKGVSIMENNPNWHFKIPGRKELRIFKEELGIEDSELE